MLMPVIVLLSQDRHDATMVLGYWSDDVYKDPVVQFNQDSTFVEYQRLVLDMQEGSCNISNKQGDLLFYFNGCSVANANHEIMDNGTGFNPGKVANNFCTQIGSAYVFGAQSSLILPVDNKDSIFMLIHITNDYFLKDSIIIYGIPRYSIIDMKANGGRGRVILKNQVYIQDTLHSIGMTAVRHANNRDWWVINQGQRGTNKFYRTLFSGGELIPMGNQVVDQPWYDPGVSGFSSDGSRYFRYSNYYGGVSVMEFDRETGLFSRERYLPMAQENIFAYGGSFSPNGKFVYISNGPYLMQIDADADVLTADTIAVWDGTAADWGQPAYFGAMQTGPDCRIYMATGYCVPFMHVIMEPDKAGKACDVRQHFFRLDVPVCYVPHFPNYRLGTPYPYCDPDIKVVTSTQQYLTETSKASSEVYPNPASEQVTIRSNRLIRGVEVADMTGRIVLRLERWPDMIWEADISELPEGVYLFRIHYGEDHKTAMKRVVIIR